ncbi:MAG: DUF202 domain-containing protein [Nitratireductor sp.]|nr:DUF202 domain-containing protein [Nitratireductor sp.]
MADRSKEQKLAEHRTGLAEDRTLMANERTFSSLVGAGLGCTGVALGIQAIFKETEPTWAAKLAASVFLATAIVIFLAAWRNAHRTLTRLNSHEATPASRQQFTRITIILCVAALLTGGILWTL